jgi:transposase-like protein
LAARRQDQIDRRQRDDGLTSDEREELARVRRENTRLRHERDLLKQAAAFFAAENDPVTAYRIISLTSASTACESRTLRRQV